MCLLSSSLGFLKALHVLPHSQLIIPVSASNGHKVEAELIIPEKERLLSFSVPLTCSLASDQEGAHFVLQRNSRGIQ